ncbi:MAG: hypothetical protein D6730_07755 [Bacteroidetes bacterium]|nr:MAG: hypothetical protein D6730_07755 [Bacteroidota bacterium]
MEYLILNEASLPFETSESARKHFPDFLWILHDAIRNQFMTVRIREDIDPGWFEMKLAPNYPLRVWLREQEREYTTRVKSIISKTEIPHIPEEEIELARRYALSEFYLEAEREIQVPALGAAYLLEQLALSFASHARWLPAEIALWHTELTETGDTSQRISARNCGSRDSWRYYCRLIEVERRESLRKGGLLWEQRAQHFPHLIFCGKTEGQLRNLSVSKTVYTQLWQVLTALNAYCTSEENFSLTSIREKTQLHISDESASVKNNPKFRQHREFRIEGEKRFFGYHVKNFSGALRLYFFPVEETRNIYIGYFGKHLPGVRDPK